MSLEKINHVNDFKWKNRVLVIKDEAKIDYSIKIDSFKRKFEERDFIIIYIKEQNAFIQNRKMSKRFFNSIQKKIKKINTNHCFFLIGKDGQVKQSYPLEIKLERIFLDVDKMPMRRYEMQTRNKK